MLKKSLAALAITALLTGTAQAQRNYIGGNLALLDYSEDTVSDDASLTGLVGRFGVFINRNLAGEVRFGVGLGHDTLTINNLDADIELDYMFGGYLRGVFPINKSIAPYIIGGITHGELTASVAGANYKLSDKDISFGAGVDLALLQGIGLNFEYMNYISTGGVDIDALTVGITKKF